MSQTRIGVKRQNLRLLGTQSPLRSRKGVWYAWHSTTNKVVTCIKIPDTSVKTEIQEPSDKPYEGGSRIYTGKGGYLSMITTPLYLQYYCTNYSEVVRS